MTNLELKGTAEELQSPRTLKVLATSVLAGVPLKICSPVGSVEELRKESIPLAKSLVLSYKENGSGSSSSSSTTHITSSNAMMKLVARLASTPVAAKLVGSDSTDSGSIDCANIDGWLSYVWTAVDVPIQAIAAATATAQPQQPQQEGGKDDLTYFHQAMKVLNEHFLYQTYMVGHCITIADISLLVSLYHVDSSGIFKLTVSHDPNDEKDENNNNNQYPNLSRWYNTMVHQQFLQSSLTMMDKGIVGKTINTSSSTTTTATTTGGVQMNGPPPDVLYHMYKRDRIRIKEVLANDGQTYLNQTVTVAGWARTTRNANKGQLLFVELNDGSAGTSLQCVLDSTSYATSCSSSSSTFEECKACGGTGASFQFIGKIISSPAQGQTIEMQVQSAMLLGPVYGGSNDDNNLIVGGKYYPMSKKAHTLEYLRENAHLRPRGRIHSTVMRIRSAMAYATHNFFHNHGFLYIHTPILTGADCEGAGEQFAVTTMLGNDHHSTDVKLPYHEPPPPEDPDKKVSKKEQKRLAKKAAAAAASKDPNKPDPDVPPVIGAVDYKQDFFANRVNLTVSGQLNVETHACALCDVYTFGPTFRAEKSYTGRHLSEFWMIEPEIAFGELHDDINLAEDYLKYCVSYALQNCADDLEFLENNEHHGEKGLRDRLLNVLQNPFKRLPYTEAIEILQKAVKEEGVTFEEEPVWGMDLPSEHERYLCEQVFRQPVVLTNYPKDIKAFYMKLNDDGKTVAAADILVPKIGEIIGGSQREHRLDVLKRRCEEMNLDPKAVWWYLDLRRYGTIPHSGFGLGFERLILFITGLQNIRDVIPFPRWAGNAEF